MTETITASLRAPRVVPRDAHGISRKDISPECAARALPPARWRLRRLPGRRRGARPAGRRPSQGFRRRHRRHARAGQGAVPQLPADRPPLPPGARGVRPRDHRGRHLPRQRRRRQRRPRDCTKAAACCATTSTARIEDDAVRRDFTANALYYAIEDFSVRDYVGGFEDVQARVLKLIGDPEARYREDPVRMLRAVRLAAKLDFSIDPAAAEPIPRLAPLLSERRAGAPVRGMPEDVPGRPRREKLPRRSSATACCRRCFRKPPRRWHTNRSGALARACCSQACAAPTQRVAERRAGDRRRSCSRCCCGRPIAANWPCCRSSGVDAAGAQRRAADRVTLHQAERIALPRRFSLPMQEIWLLQSRFSQRQRKRVFRLLAHPRFRAAFDFLELRMSGTPRTSPRTWRSGARRRSQSPSTWRRRSTQHAVRAARMKPMRSTARRASAVAGARPAPASPRRAGMSRHVDPRFVGLGGNVGDVAATR